MTPASAEDLPAGRPAEPLASPDELDKPSEQLGLLAVRRYVKDDGRALILYTRQLPASGADQAV